MTSQAGDRLDVRPEVLRRGPRLYAAAADEPRARRASDLTLLVGATLVLAAVSFAAVPQPGFARAFSSFLASLPGFLDALWQICSDLLVLLALALVAGALVRRRLSLVRDLLLSVLAAVVVWLIIGRIVQGSWPAMWSALRSAEPPPWYPGPRIAAPGAIVMTASPHMTLPMRRLGRWIIVIAAFSVTLLGATTPLGAVAGFLVAVIASAAVHLAFGSSGGRPSLHLVEAALAQLGVRIRSLGVADRQLAGYFLVDAVGADGESLVVKVYGRDAHDAALVSTIWRTVWFREPGSPLRFGRLQQVEHEAFVTLFARQAGIPTDAVVTAGATADDDALLVLRRSGTVLSDTTPGAGPAGLVNDIWRLVGRLHEAGVAHGQIDQRHLLVGADGLGIVDFRGASVAPTTTQRRTDEVQALVTTVALTGVDRAVDGALAEIGPDRLTMMLPFIQPTVLTPHLRDLVHGGAIDLDELRSHVADAVGAEVPKLQQLRRITIGSIVRVLLPAVAVIALISALAGLDFGELMEELADATWWLVVFAAFFTQVPRLTQAVSTLGASPVPLPLGPVYGLQLAVSYVNIAVPTSAARVAVNIRFFQRHGVPPGAAMAAGALDGFGGFVVQVLVLAGLLLFTPASLDLRLGDAVDSATSILAVVVVIAVVAIGVVAAVGPIRRFVLHWARRLGAEAADALRGLRSFRRLALLLGGNLATEVLFAFSLAAFARALGAPIGLDEALVINISVALLAGLMPIPGGIGVAEGGLTFGLVQAGVPEGVAFATALLYRMASFYLPPIWGFFALRWLERNEHL